MSLLSGYKINRAISIIATEGSISSNDGRQAAAVVRRLGASAIPKIIAGLEEFGQTDALLLLLKELINNETLPTFKDCIESANAGVQDMIYRALSSSKSFDPNLLLGWFEDGKISRNAIGEIMMEHHDRLDVKLLLRTLDTCGSSTRPILYKLIDSSVSEAHLELIIAKTNSNEPLIRTYLASLLAKFPGKRSERALTIFLGDNNKAVRQAALVGLAKLQAEDSVELICQSLSDPDMTVQSTAIDTLCKINARNTVRFLIDVLQDEAEYVRRAAVEVLNVIGDQRAIKDLLNALRDADWWVKVRAADALGSIGGPKVFQAVLQLIKDPDEFMRRTAVEILNTSKDAKAFDRLVEALQDEDWWVRERAADALAGLRDSRAVQPLLDMLERSPEASQVVLRALTAIGNTEAVPSMLQLLETKDDKNTQKDVLQALRELTDEEHLGDVENAITQLIDSPNREIGKLAEETVQSLIRRFGAKTAKRESSEILQIKQATDSKSSADDLSIDEESDIPSIRIVDAARLKAGDLFASRYRVIRHIGKGAFGIVVLVEDIVVHDQFILKILNPQVASDEYNIKRFTQELRYARRVTHNNVIRIYDFIKHEATYAISMEYFPSHSLRKAIVKGKPMELRSALKILNQICKGMIAAHSAEVIHRDLKPGNILIGDNSKVKIVDFGLAAATSQGDSRITKTGLLVGTPTYMAPEQVRGKQVDCRTDIYSLGIIMYEMFTGLPPYRGEDSMSVMFQHVEGKLKAPSELNPAINSEIEKIIMKCLQLNPNDRYQNFHQLATEIVNVSAETV